MTVVQNGEVIIKFNLKDPVEAKLYYMLGEFTDSKISHVVVDALKEYLLYNKREKEKKYLDIIHNLSEVLNEMKSNEKVQIVNVAETKKKVKQAESQEAKSDMKKVNAKSVNYNVESKEVDIDFSDIKQEEKSSINSDQLLKQFFNESVV